MPGKITIRLSHTLHSEIRDIADHTFHKYDSLRSIEHREEKVIIELLEIGLKQYKKKQEKTIRRVGEIFKERKILQRAGVIDELGRKKR
jgi:hypothetical protein